MSTTPKSPNCPIVRPTAHKQANSIQRRRSQTREVVVSTNSIGDSSGAGLEELVERRGAARVAIGTMGSVDPQPTSCAGAR
jgi:hypothetical protein